METPYKRKLGNTLCDSGSFKHRRSSLKVNLSYSSDSGNESLRKSHINNETMTDRSYGHEVIAYRTRSNSAKNKSQNISTGQSKHLLSNKSDLVAKGRNEKNIKLLNVTVKLTDISKKEQALHSNCDKLKEAILRKTREIFDKQNELTIKTANILENQATSSKNDQNIIVTPKIKRCDTDNGYKHRPSKKRLFTNKDQHVSIKCNNKQTENLNPLPMKDKSIIDSPILSGSNKRLRRFSLKTLDASVLQKHKMKDKLKNCISQPGRSFSALSDASTLNGSEDDLTAIGAPIICSTFIENHKNLEANCATVNNIELLQTENTQLSTENMKSVNTSNSSETNDNAACTASSNSQNHESLNKSNDRNMEAITVNNVSTTDSTNIELNKNNKQNHVQCRSDQDVSIRTIQSSLNVNTSLDKLDESGRDSNRNHVTTTSIQSKKNQENNFCGRNEGTDPLANIKDQESINTVRTSLQVNTSLESIHKRFTEEIIEQRHTNLSSNRDSMGLNDTNLKQKLRTSLRRKQENCRFTSREYKSRDKSKHSNALNTKENDNASGYMEKNDTSNLNQETNCNHSVSTVICEVHETEECHERYTVNNRLCKGHSNVAAKQTGKSCKTLEDVLQDTIVLDDTPFVQVNSSGKHPAIIINDTLCENESTENVTNENSPKQKVVTKVRGKRKLLPLHETSEMLSLTPLENLPASPKQTTFNKKRKKKKSFPKQKPLPKKVKNIIKGNKDDSSESNRTLRSNKTLEDSERQGQKQKKQRNIVSKKIVIKKFVNADIIKHLEKNRNLSSEEVREDNEHRSSLNDFQTKKIISTNKFSRSKKIVIATTGLSKGDKSLVKKIVTTLGMARLEAAVTRHTTHVVCTGVRTINLMHGIIRGCWLVSIEWVLRSLEYNKWLDPEKYEMKHFSKAVLENRKDRQLFGAFYVPELFAVCGLIYVESTTAPPANSLKELIKAAGGQITEDFRNAKVIVGTEGIKETWVLDSITTGELQPVDQYKRR